MKKFKKSISMLLVLCMLITTLPATAFATGSNPENHVTPEKFKVSFELTEDATWTNWLPKFFSKRYTVDENSTTKAPAVKAAEGLEFTGWKAVEIDHTLQANEKIDAKYLKENYTWDDKTPHIKYKATFKKIDAQPDTPEQPDKPDTDTNPSIKATFKLNESGWIGKFFKKTVTKTVEQGTSIQTPVVHKFFSKDSDGIAWKSTVGELLINAGNAVNFEQLVNALGDKYPSETDIEFISVKADKPDEEKPLPEPVEKFSVTFNTNGGNEIDTQIIEKGNKAVEPEVPVKEGYTFNGWYTDEELTTPYDFDTPVDSDITLYAGWDKTGLDSNDTKDEDDDGLPNIIENMFGTDTTLADTDEDGLSDADEIYLTGTDPILFDTDSNGISDADEDLDEDGLTNIEEIKYGTNPLIADTDNDGLNDNDEINIYKTDPTLYDTDSDGLSDGDEIKLGLNPLNPMSDGKTPDAQRTFNQIYDSDLIDEDITSENKLNINIHGNVPDNINNHVNLKSVFNDALIDNRSVIGNSVLIETDYTKDTDLWLDFICEPDDDRTEFYMICKYEDNTFVPCETITDGNVISTNITAGEYFVIDAEAFLIDLGIPIEKYKNSPTEYQINTFSLEQETLNTATSATNNTKSTSYGQADIVFVIDTTGSMSDEIHNVASNIDTFVYELLDKFNVQINFALVDYKDITENEPTKLVKDGDNNWFRNPAKYTDAIYDLHVDGGGDTPETLLDGLGMALNLDFRQNADKFIIVVTDAPYKVNNNYDIDSMETMIKLLKDKGIITSVISDNSYEKAYHDLYSETDGVFGDINSDFNQILLSLANKIGEIVNDGSWVTLNDYQLIKLGHPLDDSGYDTDSDNVSDKDELGTETNKNLSYYIDFVMKTYGLPPEDYDDIRTIKVFDYISNPILEDTDFDGIKDNDDKGFERKNGFRGSMSSIAGTFKDISYVMDYRNFFKSNKNFNLDLANASLIFANSAYNCYDFNYEKKSVRELKDLMIKHGFNKDTIEIHDLKTNYSDDHVTEVGIGKHTVKYHGLTQDVIGIFVRGTNDTVEEWSSNFDIGNPSSWKEPHTKGFYIAAKRVLEKVDEYIENYVTDPANTVYWLTGHSRGAAISNIVSSELINRGKYVYSYNFSTPNTTRNSNYCDEIYDSIFNINNSGDLVASVPLIGWEFQKYGKSMYYDVNDDIKKIWKSQTGKKYKGPSTATIKLVVSRLLNNCAPTLNDVFTYGEPQNISSKQKGYITERAEKFCKTEETSFGRYHLTPSTAFIMQLAAEAIQSKDDNLKNNSIKLLMEFANTDYGSLILGLAGSIIKSKDMSLSNLNVTEAHSPGLCYILMNNK